MKAIDASDNKRVELVLENEQEQLPVTEEMLASVRTVVLACLEYEAFPLSCEIDITFTDNDHIREINRLHRNIDRPTDVLSFPVVDMLEGRIVSSEGDMDLEQGLLLLGDILVSLEKAREQAEEYGHSFMRELVFLISHGVFHLLGYDHLDGEQEAKMFGRQEAVLTKLGFTR